MIPKPIRDAAGLTPGAEVEVEFRDGRIEIVPVTRPMRVEAGAVGATVISDETLPTLTAEAVRRTLENTRR